VSMAVDRARRTDEIGHADVNVGEVDAARRSNTDLKMMRIRRGMADVLPSEPVGQLARSLGLTKRNG
jgi:hypothetical protein